MLAQLTKGRFLVLGLAVSMLFNSCSKPSKVEPEAVVPAEYELKDVRYFLEAGDKIDTITVKLKGVSIENPGSVLSSQRFEDDFDELVKTSQFVVSNRNTLPEGVELDKFEVRVPERWYGKDSYDFSSEKFTLSADKQQKPYGGYKKEVFDLKIPPESKIVVDRQIDAYHMVCSFNGILENKTTGQQYALKGKWKGVLYYNNASATLKEYPLATN